MSKETRGGEILWAEEGQKMAGHYNNLSHTHVCKQSTSLVAVIKGDVLATLSTHTIEYYSVAICND